MRNRITLSVSLLLVSILVIDPVTCHAFATPAQGAAAAEIRMPEAVRQRFETNAIPAAVLNMGRHSLSSRSTMRLWTAAGILLLASVPAYAAAPRMTVSSVAITLLGTFTLFAPLMFQFESESLPTGSDHTPDTTDGSRVQPHTAVPQRENEETPSQSLLRMTGIVPKVWSALSQGSSSAIPEGQMPLERYKSELGEIRDVLIHKNSHWWLTAANIILEASGLPRLNRFEDIFAPNRALPVHFSSYFGFPDNLTPYELYVLSEFSHAKGVYAHEFIAATQGRTNQSELIGALESLVNIHGLVGELPADQHGVPLVLIDSSLEGLLATPFVCALADLAGMTHVEAAVIFQKGGITKDDVLKGVFPLKAVTWIIFNYFSHALGRMEATGDATLDRLRLHSRKPSVPEETTEEKENMERKPTALIIGRIGEPRNAWGFQSATLVGAKSKTSDNKSKTPDENSKTLPLKKPEEQSPSSMKLPIVRDVFSMIQQASGSMDPYFVTLALGVLDMLAVISSERGDHRQVSDAVDKYDALLAKIDGNAGIDPERLDLYTKDWGLAHSPNRGLSRSTVEKLIGSVTEKNQEIPYQAIVLARNILGRFSQFDNLSSVRNHAAFAANLIRFFTGINAFDYVVVLPQSIEVPPSKRSGRTFRDIIHAAKERAAPSGAASVPETEPVVVEPVPTYPLTSVDSFTVREREPAAEVGAGSSPGAEVQPFKPRTILRSRDHADDVARAVFLDVNKELKIAPAAFQRHRIVARTEGFSYTRKKGYFAWLRAWLIGTKSKETFFLTDGLSYPQGYLYNLKHYLLEEAKSQNLAVQVYFDGGMSESIPEGHDIAQQRLYVFTINWPRGASEPNLYLKVRGGPPPELAPPSAKPVKSEPGSTSIVTEKVPPTEADRPSGPLTAEIHTAVVAELRDPQRVESAGNVPAEPPVQTVQPESQPAVEPISIPVHEEDLPPPVIEAPMTFEGIPEVRGKFPVKELSATWRNSYWSVLPDLQAIDMLRHILEAQEKVPDLVLTAEQEKSPDKRLKILVGTLALVAELPTKKRLRPWTSKDANNVPVDYEDYFEQFYRGMLKAISESSDKTLRKDAIDVVYNGRTLSYRPETFTEGRPVYTFVIQAQPERPFAYVYLTATPSKPKAPEEPVPAGMVPWSWHGIRYAIAKFMAQHYQMEHIVVGVAPKKEFHFLRPVLDAMKAADIEISKKLLQGELHRDLTNQRLRKIREDHILLQIDNSWEKMREKYIQAHKKVLVDGKWVKRTQDHEIVLGKLFDDMVAAMIDAFLTAAEGTLAGTDYRMALEAAEAAAIAVHRKHNTLYYRNNEGVPVGFIGVKRLLGAA